MTALLGAACALLAGQAAGFPTPQAAGFHHCALIYHRPTRGPVQFAPYVARRTAGRPREWLFDAFLFLHFTTPDGTRTDSGQTRQSDWQRQLDTWFAPGRDLAALDSAIAEAARTLGPPSAPRRIVLTIPYTHPLVKAFGDVDADGAAEGLDTLQGRRKVLAWYVAEVRKRFEAARFRHLRLWGLYWMAESAPESDAPMVRTAADAVHGAGLRFLWIPWYRAAGWDRWRELGFDVALMQPNYAFVSCTHGGRVRRNRLAVAADLARSRGLGIEVEAGALTTSEADRSAFLNYLEDGHRARPAGSNWPWGGLGYQHAATAYYLGVDMVEQAAASPDPAVRRTYAALADYIGGRPVRAPVTARKPGAGWGTVDVCLGQRPPGWTGIVEVTGRSAPHRPRRGLGWALAPSAAPDDLARQVVTVPVGLPAVDVKVGFAAADGRGPRVLGTYVSRDVYAERSSHLAVGRAYSQTPPPPARYPDTGGTELTDGLTPTDGFAGGGTVGWWGSAVTVVLDLGSPQRVDRVEVDCQGGGEAAVHWPGRATAIVSAGDAGAGAAAGRGRVPPDLRWALAGAPRITRSRGPRDHDGTLTFGFKPAASARWVTLVFDSDAWLMLSEVRVWAGDRNVARGTRYVLTPRPHPPDEGGERYADNGRRLTDGVVAQTFAPAEVTGFEGRDATAWAVELGRTTAVREVAVWCLGGGEHGITAPRAVDVAVWQDGAWREVGRAARPPVPEDGTASRPVVYRVPVAYATSRVRVRVLRGSGWAMVSEIAVH